jgi:hypothetical protein
MFLNALKCEEDDQITLHKLKKKKNVCLMHNAIFFLSLIEVRATAARHALVLPIVQLC